MVRSYGLTLEDLEESLTDILPSGFEIKIIKGKVIIHTNLVENSHGELIQQDDTLDSDDEDDDDNLEDCLLDDEDQEDD